MLTKTSELSMQGHSMLPTCHPLKRRRSTSGTGTYLIKMLLKLFIGKVDAKLLKATDINEKGIPFKNQTGEQIQYLMRPLVANYCMFLTTFSKVDSYNMCKTKNN